MRGERFLTKPRQYERVYSQGTSNASRSVIVKAVPNSLELSRYGISVSRRVGNAVKRNRVKRRLREILKSVKLRPGWDIVIIARPPAVDIDYSLLAGNIESLLERSGIAGNDTSEMPTQSAKRE